MYSEAELQSAVAAGAISREAAQALRDHANGMRNAPGCAMPRWPMKNISG